MKNKFKISRYLLSTIALCALAFTSNPTLAQDFVARIGHLESPQQSRHVHLERVAGLVAERTDGAVEFQLFPKHNLETNE